MTAADATGTAPSADERRARPARSDVALVVVNHDTREELLGCLGTARTGGADQIVVVDAGSADGSASAAREAHPDVEMLELPNVGYARAANAGAARTTAPVVVVANADTRFEPGSLRRLAAAIDADPGLGAAGPFVRYPDGRPQASARRLPTLGEALAHALLGLWWPRNRWTRAYRMVDADVTAPRDVDWLSGCVLALRREAFAEVGGFDPGYFMYVEDVDLGLRLRRAGWQLRYIPEAGVIHRVGASTGRRRSSMVVAHARSLDRFFGNAYAHRRHRHLRPLVRLGLVVWVALVLGWERLVGRRTGRSSTGE